MSNNRDVDSQDWEMAWHDFEIYAKGVFFGCSVAGFSREHTEALIADLRQNFKKLEADAKVIAGGGHVYVRDNSEEDRLHAIAQTIANAKRWLNA